MHHGTRRRLAVTLTVLALAAVGVPSAQAGGTRDVRGTSLTRATLTSRGGSAQAWLERVDLTDRRLHIEPVLADNVVDGHHESVPAMAQRTHAVVGINGDFWNWVYPEGPPLRGLWIHGHMYKTPGHETSANFYTTTDGRAHIGKVNVAITLTWHTRSGAARRSAVYSTNNYDDMMRRHLVAVTKGHGRHPVAAVHRRLAGRRPQRLQGLRRADPGTRAGPAHRRAACSGGLPHRDAARGRRAGAVDRAADRHRHRRARVRRWRG